ncbi:hypothetical protein TIFTF001_000585 [Ficus carica]|uniref:Uncharacterized protein n=1 Tax=Ficus carica TaxID=3494 RepID=A0AA87Z537_FICCA|nr:hypothetical protein TIFTF001_000585 [Ficus carica]
MAVTQIFTSQCFSEDGSPVEGGLMDPRLGPMDEDRFLPILDILATFN